MQRVLDGNGAVAEVAYACNEMVAIYPITPASTMGELADKWSADGRPNLWGQVPRVVEMQSEGGAAGTVHGSLQAGCLTTTFTASQGLLLMLPNMFKIAGELTPAVFYIAARTVATHALSIFGDHSDVMAARSTGWAMLFAASVQEAHDFALISQAATLASRVPFLHIMDGFRTSHEECKISLLEPETMLQMLSHDDILAHRQRGLTPERPSLRGTAQNPDVYFQSREASNPYYARCPELTREAMRKFAELTGRNYDLFEYIGHPEAERVIVIMGSAIQTVAETVDHLLERGEKVGVLKVRLFQPFAADLFCQALPASVRQVAVLDRCHEPGALGEPLFLDVMAALGEADRSVRVINGRYGLASKEFTPGMAAAVFAELQGESARRRFSVGIEDDVTHLSLNVADLDLEDHQSVRAVFWGLGSDGTVGANKSTIRIIGEETPLYAQGYFVYDSKKSGARTISHLRFGPRPIGRPYLIQRASFIAVHQWEFVRRFAVLHEAEEGATVLINCPFSPDEAWERLPAAFCAELHRKRLRLFVVDAYRLARENGLGGRINTIMQTCFFHLSQVLPAERASALLEDSVRHSYSRRGEPIVARNIAAIRASLAELHEVPLGPAPAEGPEAEAARDFLHSLLEGRGDELPVSSFNPDGTYPTNTARLERRCLSQSIPHWESQHCIQCGKCVFVCPHAVIRAKLVSPASLEDAPAGYVTLPSAFKELPDHRYSLEVSEEDCTGCRLCVEICPTKEKSLVMGPLTGNRADWEYFLDLPEEAPAAMRWTAVKNVQLRQPLFEFSGACAGCGETPYLRLLSQLYGDHLVVANATGCSSIYGGNLPTTPWAQDRQGHGPAWSNSLFEDNAEFGLGLRLALEQQADRARQLIGPVAERFGVPELLRADLGVDEARLAVRRLRPQLGPDDRDLAALCDSLIPHSVWIVGGDGWAYDIDAGGLDHVLSGNSRVRILVLDTEVYSNTGGQASKATPLGAEAKFAAGGKGTRKKDLGMQIMDYGHCYVASIAMGANETQTLKAFQEAESFPGPALILAYCQCIAHGIDMAEGMHHQKLAVESGAWLLYRYDPRLPKPLQMDCKAPSRPLQDYLQKEARFRLLDPAHSEGAQQAVDRRWTNYAHRAGV